MKDGQGTTEKLDKILEGARKFEVENDLTGDVKEYFLVMPNAEEIKQSQWEYAKSYNMALKQGIFTSDELLDILKRRNIVGEDLDRQISDVRAKLDQKKLELELADDREERVEIAREASKLRTELVRLNGRFLGPMNNTCESLATEARNEYLTSVVLRNSDGTRVWETFEDYVNEQDTNLHFKARMHVGLWLEGLEPGFLENEPDQVILREFEKEELEKLTEAVEEAEKAVEASKELAEESVSEEVEKKPKRTRRKKSQKA